MAVRTPVYFNGADIQQMSTAQIDKIKRQAKYQYSLNPSVSLSYAASGGTLGSINDTRFQSSQTFTNPSSAPATTAVNDFNTNNPVTVANAHINENKDTGAITITADGGHFANIKAQSTEAGASGHSYVQHTVGNNGTRLYSFDYTGERIFQFDLGTAYSILDSAQVTPSGFFNHSFLTTVAGTAGSVSYIPRGWDMHPKGERLYLCHMETGTDNTRTSIDQFNLGTAWDLSTVDSASRVTFVPTNAEVPYLDAQSLRNIKFSVDGTKLLTVSGNNSANDRVRKYTLSTPWDISTASYDSDILPRAGEILGLWGVEWGNDEGTTVITASTYPQGGTPDHDGAVRIYNLSTPFTLSTGTLVDSINMAGILSAPTAASGTGIYNLKAPLDSGDYSYLYASFTTDFVYRNNYSDSSANPVEDTNNIKFPCYLDGSNDVQPMTDSDFIDTFIKPALQSYNTTDTTADSFSGIYHIQTATTYSGSTLVNANPIFTDTRNVGTVTGVNQTQDQPTNVTSYYLYLKDGDSTEHYDIPLHVYNTNGDVYTPDSAAFGEVLQNMMRYCSVYVDSCRIDYAYTSGTQRGVSMTDTRLNAYGTYQSIVGVDDYRAQTHPTGTATTISTYYLGITIT